MKSRITLILFLLSVGVGFAQKKPIYYAKKDVVYIYQNMDINSAIIGEIPKGGEVKVLDSFFSNTGFWKISYDEIEGYVKINDLSYKKVSKASDNTKTKRISKSAVSNKKVNFNPFLGETTSSVNLRTTPSTDSSKIKTLLKGTTLYVYSTETVNSFYKVIDVETSKIGWVHKNFVKYIEKVDVNSQGAFQSTGYSSNYNSEVSVRNKSSYYIKLVIDDEVYSLSPHSTETISVKPGRKYYIATAPGVIPSSGYQSFEANNGYEWQFWVSTSMY